MNPYFQYGAAQRYPFQWRPGQGGVLPNTHAPASSLGAADMLEGGYGDPNAMGYPAFAKTKSKACCPPGHSVHSLGAAVAEYTGVIGSVLTSIATTVSSIAGGGTAKPRTAAPPRRFSPAAATMHRRALGEWPLVRQQGFEPGWAATGAIPIWSGLSSTQKTVTLMALGAGALWWLARSSSKRGGGPLGLTSRRNPWTVTSRTRGVTGSLTFRTKKRADEYAAYLRRSNKSARVRRK